VELPNGLLGYVPSSAIEGFDSSLESVSVGASTPVRAHPSEGSAVVRRVEAEVELEVLARFGSYALVGSEHRRSEWVLAPASTSTAP
jgi:uncharacterized protein YgiM (DUF1202 family)